MKNSYYDIGYNDYLFAKNSLELCNQTGNYNAVVSIFSQSAEKLLKEIIEIKFADDSTCFSVLRTHNLRTIVNKIKERYPDIALNSIECKWLGDFYFDARYPGDNFVIVNKEDAYQALAITEHILSCVDTVLHDDTLL
ncbi:MAG: HEPN domain-containing protein [Eubacteriales bacterium]